MEHITIKAQEGKVFRRIADGMVFGNRITLGYTHYLGGEKLVTPLWELPEHYEEVDAPIELDYMEQMRLMEDEMDRRHQEEMRLREEEMERQHQEEMRRHEEEMLREQEEYLANL